ncbi:hypothetical protein A7981_06365 [Methylovorus sp. MM2]|uniref:DUF805 domain-containing protein n=1 Tax=Methylovorus sp. MM2 TaxID=1848038 RepID=UPI0007E06AEA|nr:DUF805 domain-containing protein [Methylovorus sp. MM2]OAM53042.1 hypothetical protein A7981_06365 [Methylovorus sp. MM2]
MTFSDSIKVCFSKYIDITGRAKRPEYWWFVLLLFLGSLVLGFISDIASMVFSLATLLPSIAVGVRRLHDTNRSGWWLLLGLIPIIGWIILIVFMATEGESTDNEYGSVPTE